MCGVEPTPHHLIFLFFSLIPTKQLTTNDLGGAFCPSLAMRIAMASAVLTRAVSANRAGKAARQVGHDVLRCCVQRVKQARQ